MTVTCKFNQACVCEEREKNGYLVRDCDRCGWNPAIEKKRKAQMNADQFMRDANAPTRTFIVVGASIKNGNARPVTMVCQKSPQGNMCVKIGEEMLVIPGSTAKEVINGR